MDRRDALSLILASTVTGSGGLGVDRFAQESTDAEKVQWVARILAQMGQIKPGMRRADLLSVFETEGGLSTGLRRTYVHRQCPYFKVDVTFQAVGRSPKDEQGRETLAEDDRDEILSLSRPYLAFSIAD